MDYYKPLQHLGFVYFKKNLETYLESTINVLVKAGETLARLNSSNSPYLIQYRIIPDQSNAGDYLFQDVVLIRADEKTSKLISAAISNLGSLKAVASPALPVISVKVEIYRADGTLGGSVTTTTPINDDADIEIR